VVLLIVRRFIKKRSGQFIVSTIVLWSYSVAVGAQSAVVRASLMFTFVALAPLLSRRANSLNALGGAALFLLVWRPSELFDPSFQLTFFSVLTIVVIAAPLLRKLSVIGAWQPTREAPYPPVCAGWLRDVCEALFWSERGWQAELARSNHRYRLFKSPYAAWLERYHLQRFLRYALNAAVISASVQLGLLPLLIIYFHRVAPAAIILSIGVGLLMALLAITALAALFVMHLSVTWAAPIIVFANAVNWLMVHCVDLFSPLGGAAIRLPEYTGWPAAIYAIYYLPLAGLAVTLGRWNPLAAPRTLSSSKNTSGKTVATLLACVQSVLLLLLIFHPLSAGKADGKLRVDFLDVGQGDSALVTMPDGSTLLIDGGGRPSFQGRRRSAQADEEGGQPEQFERDTRSIGEAVVSEYLWWRGLDRVDCILATHADADHIDGLNDVARNFKVRSALVARTPPDDPEYAKFAATLAARNIPVKVIGSGDELHFGGATVSILWPLLTNDASAPSANNDSIVLRLRFGDRTILMTGDVEKEGEAAIINAGNELTSDVVKVPHHGSKTSSTSDFVLRTQARLAVISVGLTSVFGHPNKEVVERWRASGAEVLTTGKRGTITVTTDGKALSVESFVRD
jgi:competence protein ComEC